MGHDNVRWQSVGITASVAEFKLKRGSIRTPPNDPNGTSHSEVGLVTGREQKLGPVGALSPAAHPALGSSNVQLSVTMLCLCAVTCDWSATVPVQSL